MVSARVAMVSLLASLATACAVPQVAEMVAMGDSRVLRQRPAQEPHSSPQSSPRLLIFALDGVGRREIYSLLHHGELPELAALLGGRNGSFAHAYFDRRVLSTLPSSTIPGWVTLFTGVEPGRHGAVGNEFFIRQTREFVAPAPVTFSDARPALAVYTDGYLNDFVEAPSVYQRMRTVDPHLQVWVAMLHYYAGADRLLTTDRGVLAGAFSAFLEEQLEENFTSGTSRKIYEELDEEVAESVIEELEEESTPRPDVLTVYLSGADLYAHVAQEGPDEARKSYLKEVLEPQFAKLRKAFQAAHILDGSYVLVLSDHGHTQVAHDVDHALGTATGDGDPAELIERAGFRVRPFEWKVDGASFQAVLAYQGAMAFVYLADRSTCPTDDSSCDWSQPPRYEEDVLKLADAFYVNNQKGGLVDGMKGALDMILVRKTTSPRQPRPFSVYVGGGRDESIARYLAQHPHPRYVALAERMKDLATGPQGYRAGDLVLLAHNGDRKDPDERYYFANEYHSWHGSPDRRDSEISLIVGNANESKARIRSLVRGALGPSPRQQDIANVLMALRYGSRM